MERNQKRGAGQQARRYFPGFSAFEQIQSPGLECGEHEFGAEPFVVLLRVAAADETKDTAIVIAVIVREDRIEESNRGGLIERLANIEEVDAVGAVGESRQAADAFTLPGFDDRTVVEPDGRVRVLG